MDSFLDGLYSFGSFVGLLFFVILLALITPQFLSIFFKSHGRNHRMFGLFYIMWILYGFYGSVVSQSKLLYFVYDVVLGCLGTILTLTAASDFSYHKNVKNAASGTLDDKSTVTYDEMIEHSFYQVLNLFQIMYLHALTIVNIYIKNDYAFISQLLLLLVATSPWLVRNRFPINRFSDNYTKPESTSGTSKLIQVLYRLKKYQYLLYKHWLLHSLNASLILLPTLIVSNLENSLYLPNDLPFRLFWILLNTSYVMEFFLQTLVKRKYLDQNVMLILQQLLMLASTCAAIPVLRKVSHLFAFTSLIMNLVHRKHEVMNLSVLVGSFLLAEYMFGKSIWII